MDSENIERLIGERVSKVIENTLSKLLGTDAFLAITKQMKGDYKVDLVDYNELVEDPESFEMALFGALGHGAHLLLRGICQNLIKEFSVNPPESFQYQKVGDYVKLVYNIKTTPQNLGQ